MILATVMLVMSVYQVVTLCRSLSQHRMPSHKYCFSIPLHMMMIYIYTVTQHTIQEQYLCRCQNSGDTTAGVASNAKTVRRKNIIKQDAHLRLSPFVPLCVYICMLTLSITCFGCLSLCASLKNP